MDDIRYLFNIDSRTARHLFFAFSDYLSLCFSRFFFLPALVPVDSAISLSLSSSLYVYITRFPYVARESRVESGASARLSSYHFRSRARLVRPPRRCVRRAVERRQPLRPWLHDSSSFDIVGVFKESSVRRVFSCEIRSNGKRRRPGASPRERSSVAAAALEPRGPAIGFDLTTSRREITKRRGEGPGRRVLATTNQTAWTRAQRPRATCWLVVPRVRFLPRRCMHSKLPVDVWSLLSSSPPIAA